MQYREKIRDSPIGAETLFREQTKKPQIQSN
jgi:hypothetical protein